MTPEELLKDRPVDNADMLEVLRRGTARVLYQGPRALILRDGCGTIFFWAGGPDEEAREAAARSALPYLPKEGLFCAHGARCAALVREWTGCGSVEPCWQARYPGPPPPAPAPGVRLQTLDERYTDVVLEHYHFVDDAAYIRQRVASGVMLGAFVPAGPAGPEQPPAGGPDGQPALLPGAESAASLPGERLAGFIGLHGEGGIGMLEVFPEYRRRGLAAALVQGMVRRRLAEGAIPFGHIVKGNEPSLRLQKKLGFRFSEEFVYWIS